MATIWLATIWMATIWLAVVWLARSVECGRRCRRGPAVHCRGCPTRDLRSLLLSVARDRAETARPSEVLRRWREDRFVRPARADPRVLARVEARMWQLLPADVAGVELSPVVPVGTCAAVAPVSQNRIVTTMRASEVLSDPTNALAIEAALRRRRQSEVHLAAAHRVLRAQDFGGDASAHFRLFALVSSVRDTGSGDTQARLLVRHLTYWRTVLAELAPAAAPQLHVTTFDDEAVRERLADTVRPALAARCGAALGRTGAVSRSRLLHGLRPADHRPGRQPGDRRRRPHRLDRPAER